MTHDTEKLRETLIHHEETDTNYEGWECGNCGAIFEEDPVDVSDCPKCGVFWRYEWED